MLFIKAGITVRSVLNNGNMKNNDGIFCSILMTNNLANKSDISVESTIVGGRPTIIFSKKQDFSVICWKKTNVYSWTWLTIFDQFTNQTRKRRRKKLSYHFKKNISIYPLYACGCLFTSYAGDTFHPVCKTVFSFLSRTCYHGIRILSLVLEFRLLQIYSQFITKFGNVYCANDVFRNSDYIYIYIYCLS